MARPITALRRSSEESDGPISSLLDWRTPPSTTEETIAPMLDDWLSSIWPVRSET